MRTIKVWFTDFWPGFKFDSYFPNFLQQHWKVVFDADAPDYLFYSVYGHQHLKYTDCVRIFYTGENMVPDFNVCDYALGFHHLQFEDRYMRFPLYLLYAGYSDVDQRTWPADPAALLQRKFCNFVYTNNSSADPARDRFFELLSRYRRVDSGGKHLNNIGGAVADKMDFIRQYKFTIAFENSLVSGYTTEKLLQPLQAMSVPIYYGNPVATLDFNSDSFVLVRDPSAMADVVERVIALDKDDAAYLHLLRQPLTLPGNRPADWTNRLHEFFTNIFEQPMSSARRRARHGFNLLREDRLRQQAEHWNRHEEKSNLLGRIRKWMTA